MDHKRAREVVIEAFKREFPGVEPTLGALQLIQANGLFEGSYGEATKPPEWIGSNNWGAVQFRAKVTDGKCPEGSFPAMDQGPQGDALFCYKKYPTPVDGCADMIRHMVKGKGAKEALLAGDLPGLCRAMREASYYVNFSLMRQHGAAKGKELDIQNRIRIIDDRVSKIAKALGEPVAITNVDRGSDLPIAASEGAIGVLALMLGAAYFIIYRRRVT